MMREDIQELIKNRPLYRLLADQQYREILAAIDYATKHKKTAALTELEAMLEDRKRQVLGQL